MLYFILANSIVTPFYIKPADVLSYSIAATASLLLVYDWEAWDILSRTVYTGSMVIFFALILVAVITMLTNERRNDFLYRISNILRLILEIIGSPRIIFSLLYIFAIITFHYPNAYEVLLLSILWGFIFITSPIEALIESIKRINFSFKKIEERPSEIGEVIAYQQPDIVLIKQRSNMNCKYLTPILINDRYENPKIALSLDYVGRAEGMLLRALKVLDLPREKLTGIIKGLPLNSTFKVSSNIIKQIIGEEITSNFKNIIGLVGTDTTIDILQFEVVKNEDLSEGRLIETLIDDKMVIYQVINGITKEEIVEKKNTFGYIKAKAKKIGVWNDNKKKFETVHWLPKMNSPVYLSKMEEYIPDSKDIGHFPESNYPVKIADINSLVTHNTAILGILGIGKSMLAIEIVERLINSNIKVICLDLTNQYANELNAFYDLEYEEKCIEEIRQAGDKDRDQWNENPSEGGSLENFQKALYDDLHGFIKEENGNMLKIYNPSRIFATKQFNEPRSYMVGGSWRRSAVLYDITPVEVTQIITEITLGILSDQMVDYAQVCLVYEEAHSLIPEWNSVAVESDRIATSCTARAILQGRKYGLGCILVTQRTANVTKTILNQCNNLFAMRTYDNTGIEFLGNYIGKDYASILSTLPPRHAIYFGKSSSCENPVIIRLNDRDLFIRTFRG